jgi:hypothetical protein
MSLDGHLINIHFSVTPELSVDNVVYPFDTLHLHF